MTHISKVVPVVLVLVMASMLAACETFDGPTAPSCYWHYTKSEATVLFDSTTASERPTGFVNTDSVWTCRNPFRE